MPRRLPPEAFDAYLAAGPGRSYAAVAARFRVSEAAVGRAAARERWEARVAELDAWVRTQVEAAPGTASELIARHRKILQAIQGKSLEALRSSVLRDGSAAVRALQLSLAQERRLLQALDEGRRDELDAAARAEYDAWANGVP